MALDPMRGLRRVLGDSRRLGWVCVAWVPCVVGGVVRSAPKFPDSPFGVPISTQQTKQTKQTKAFLSLVWNVTV